MKVPFRWLQEYVDIDISPEEFAQRMTMAGLEAEQIDYVGDGWDKVYVAEVLNLSPHPDADRLVLADVAAGEHRLTVVTGAPNIEKSQKVVLALAGARLIDAYADELKYKTLKPGKIRGITSEGMVCSEKELGLSDEHEGILVLDDDAPVGAPLADYLGDAIIEFEITPNLVHAFSMVGIAREAAALLEKSYRAPKEADLSTSPSRDDLVTIEAPELASRYVGVVIEGISIEPSPSWMAQRLNRAGVRPVNNIVDVTNYVLLEMGQPLHAFDLKTIETGHIVVRRGKANETIETLDHRTREVDEDTLLITDGNRPVGIAGVMGGVNSEVTDDTTAIVLESATFGMVNIRHTSRNLKLRTDASARFERGLDPELAIAAAQRAVHLILELCPNARVVEHDDTYPNPVEPRQVALPFSRFERVLGIEVDRDQALGVLERLELQPRLDDATGVLTVTVPTWRSDITIPEDVVEEAARMIGYHLLPATLPTGTTPEVERDGMFLLERKVRNMLAGGGMYEGRSYVTLSEEEVDRWSSGTSLSLTAEVPTDAAVQLLNPVNTERPLLRPSLLPSLLPAVGDNLKHQQSVRLFEVAHVYASNGPGQLPNETSNVAGVLAGRREELDRFNPASDEMDFWDAKGVVDALGARLGLTLSYERTTHPAFHPGRTASVLAEGTRLGIVGEIHPNLTDEYGVEARTAAFELSLDALQGAMPDIRGIQVTTDQYLPVQQDFSIVVDADTAAADVEASLMQGAGPLATDLVLFDVYQGDNIEAGKKSLTFRVTFTAPNRALTDKELEKVRKKIEKTLQRGTAATLRAVES
ncbi:MAG TPA: phenylalanine--tRNA ligase subunit beta [Thermomicrobiales bacterium]|nr:phenylalanine--tRNA ligase subunit beta [Thermomicrobiales bacterium]